MGFGGQMHDGVWLVLAEHAVELGAVADVDAFEGVARVVSDRLQRLEVAGVGQLVDVDHRVCGAGNDVTHDGRTDEAGTTCY